MDTKHIINLIEERKEELFELLSSLVKIPSEGTPSWGKEEQLARHIHSLCQELGLESEIYSPLELDGFEEHPDYLPGRGLENRYNVSAVWKGVEDINELMIMGHSDTVQTGDPENWEFDPFCGLIKDGKIFGRGSVDDKYALATALFLIKLLKEEGFEPKRNLVFSAYSDEEYGGSHGAMAASMKYPCNRIVNMDGREDQIWHCASGGGEFKYIYHTANPADSAKNAALAIPVVLEVLDNFAKNRSEELEANRFYSGTIIPKTSLRYMGIRAGNNGQDLGKGEIHFVYYTDKTKDEIYAELAEFEKEIEKKLAPLGIIGDGFKPATRFFHYAYCEPDNDSIKDMVDASIEVNGIEPIVCGSCLSDLSVISKYGNSSAFAYGCGRDFSKKGGAHQPNEYIECDALVKFAKTIATYIIKSLG